MPFTPLCSAEMFDERAALGISVKRGFHLWWLFLTLGTAGAIVGHTVAGALPEVYRASTTLLVGAPLTAPFLQPDDLDSSERLARLMVEIVPQEPVLSGVIERLRLDTTWQQLQGRIHTLVEGRSERLVFVTATANSAAEATAIVREIPRQLGEVLFGSDGPPDQTETRRFIFSRLLATQHHIAETQHTANGLRLELSSAAPEEIAGLQARLEAAGSLLARWNEALTSTYRSLEHSVSPGHLEVIETSEGVSTPVSPNTRAVTAAAAAAGMLIALLIASALEGGARKRFRVQRRASLPPIH